MGGRRRTVGVLIAGLVAGAACGLEPEHGYVLSGDGSLSFRHPGHWTDVDVDPMSTEWVVGIDASSEPNRSNATEFVLDDPFVVAQVLPLDANTRDATTVSALRTLALTDRRDPLDGDDPSIRILFHETFVDEQGFEGHHMRFEFDSDNGTAVEEQLAVLDPNRARVQRVRVACSVECFESNTTAIEALFESVRLRP